MSGNITFHDYVESNHSRFINEEATPFKKARNTLLNKIIYPHIGCKPVADISADDLSSIFVPAYPDSFGFVTIKRTFWLLNNIFNQLFIDGLIDKNPMKKINNPLELYYRHRILNEGIIPNLTSSSCFYEVSFSWLKSKDYKEVTYELYLRFLREFINPFIGWKKITAISSTDIFPIFRYFDTVATNQTWVNQCTLVMRMIFDYAVEKGLIATNPFSRINQHKVIKLVELTNDQKNKVREIYYNYGFRQDKKSETILALYNLLNEEDGDSDQSGPSFEKVFLEYFNNRRKGILTSTSVNRIYFAMYAYPILCFGKKPIFSVTVKNIKAICDTYLLMGAKTNSQFITEINKVMDYAFKNGYLKKKPSLAIQYVSLPYEQRDILSDEEIKMFLSLCLSERYGNLFAIELLLGLRIGEALAIKVSNIDLEDSSIVIDSTISHNEFANRTKTGVTRKIKLSESAKFFIKRALDTRVISKKYPDLLFVNDKGEFIKTGFAHTEFKRIAVKINRPDIKTHVLRHTFMTISTRCGDSIEAIQGSVGHKKHTSNIIHYLHQNNDSREKSAIKKQHYLEEVFRRYDKNRDIN